MFLASRGFAARRSRACALPLLNLKKKRDFSQSTAFEAISLILVVDVTCVLNEALHDISLFVTAVCLEPDIARDAMGSTRISLFHLCVMMEITSFFSSLTLCNIQILTLV